MATLWSVLAALFNRQPREPPTFATDRIVPIPSEDDIPRHRATILNIFWRFDDALDAEKLQRSLIQLLHRPGWNKMGGRLRLNARGNMECHIPATFDAQRPPVAFHHQAYAVSIAEHALASRLPIAAKGKGRPQIVEHSDDFLALMRQPYDPKCLRDYLQSDLPALGVHVVTFTDATFITLRCSHLVIDLVGIKSLVDAWSLVLQGREAEVPSVHGIETGPMETLGADQEASYTHAGKLLGPWKLSLLGLRLAGNALWQWMVSSSSSPEEVESLCLICVPSPYLRSLRNVALLNLARKSEASNGKDAPFVTEGDVLLAWWTRLLVPHVAASAEQTISIIVILELRSLLVAKGLLPVGSAYLGNALSYVPLFMPARDLFAASLGDVAHAVRRALVMLSTREQVEAFVALRHTRSEASFVLGDAGMKVLVGSNGTKARLFDIDFSAALVKEGYHQGGQQAGRPSLVYSHNLEPPLNPLVDVLYIMGKDADGNHWLFTRLKRKVWAQINQAICDEALIIE